VEKEPEIKYYLIMIAKLEGKVLVQEENSAIIDIGGLGYRVYVSNNVLEKTSVGKTISLWTHLVVRENVLDLYGFIDKEERDFFELLIAISGVGPKSALAILTLAPVETLEKAIASEDAAYLTKVSGIGKKNAQKIILELKDKLDQSKTGDGLGLKEETEALEALRALGYTLHDSREALKKTPESATSTNERIKEALKKLGNS
jgi:holliday junction DNA helicase RuvA